MRDELLRLAKASQEENAQVATKRLASVLQHARDNSAWWRERLAGRTVEPDVSGSVPLQDLPITTRSDLQTFGKDMRILLPNTEPADYGLFVTSGSTGEPRQVVRHRGNAALLADALTLLEWAWHERDSAALIAEFRVNHEDADDARPQRPLQYLNAAAVSVRRSSTHRTPAELLDELEKVQPRYLFCNGLMLRLMAIEQLRSPRRISGLEQVLSVSDRVDPSTRQLVRDAFGARVCDRYSSEEFGIIALECPVDEHMHVIAPRFIVEAVDENNHPTPAGEPGRLLITSLTDYAQPMIRYDIGDIGVLGGTCSGGITWPILDSIQGRTRQLVRRADGSSALITLVGSQLLSMRNLLDFHLIRYRNAFVIRTRTAVPLTTSECEEITAEVRRVFREDRPVHIEPVSDAMELKTWKRNEFDDVDEDYQRESSAS